MLRVYSYMYWKSGTSDLLVLMLFVLQCTDYKKILLLLLLRSDDPCRQLEDKSGIITVPARYS